MMKALLHTIRISLLTAFLFTTCAGLLAQINPAPEQSQSILITGLTAHIGNGEKIEGAAIGFENGKIIFIGSERNVKRHDYNRVIETAGHHVYPGFIAPNSTLGLMEIGAVRATKDYSEIGTYKPNIRAAIAFNTDSEITPTVRSNGVLLGQITPRSGVISGTSSVMQFDAWNWEDAVVKLDDGIHLNWPTVYHRHWEKSVITVQFAKTYEQQKQEIHNFFSSALAYASGGADKTDVKFEAMAGLFDGKKRLYAHANDVKQIIEIVNFKKDYGLKNVVIVGGRDSHLVPDLIRDNDISVMVQRVHSTPRYAEDDVDLPFKLPKLLQDEGVLFCLENSGSMSEMGTRNLPFYAGTAVAYGLTYEQGVQSLTLNTAKILGIDAQYGSLEVGKSATLFISQGDAFDMMGNKVTHAWIDGRELDLDNRQEQLYRKYKAKYDGQE
jgi:imidazolonepropionase-like amidohydrolase